MVGTDRGSRLSSGEISGGEAPWTLFDTKFIFVSTSIYQATGGAA